MLEGSRVVAISIVSHGHGEMVSGLVSQLLECPQVSKIIITKNIPEQLLLPLNSIIQVIENKYPKGFGENHNFAFMMVKDEYFCPINPDIRLINNPFPRLIEVQTKFDAELIAPIALNKFGDTEDSVRHFPTLLSLGKKLFFNNHGGWNITPNSDVIFPEWVAGMFMLFRASAYKKLHGFDEIFFLYYEDVDICVRLRKAGMKLLVDPSVCVIHDARRASRHNFDHMILHLKSMGIYFLKYFMRLPKN